MRVIVLTFVEGSKQYYDSYRFHLRDISEVGQAADDIGEFLEAQIEVINEEG